MTILVRTRKTFITNSPVEAPHESVSFAIGDTDGGFLPPRLSQADRDALSVDASHDGLLIYNTDLENYEYYHDEFGWILVKSDPIIEFNEAAVDLDATFNGYRLHNTRSTQSDIYVPAGLPPYFEMTFAQKDPSGSMHFHARPGVTLHAPADKFYSNGFPAFIRLYCLAQDVFCLTGDLSD